MCPISSFILYGVKQPLLFDQVAFPALAPTGIGVELLS